MVARAIWKGVIRFGKLKVAVKLFSAVEDRGVHFRLLHEADMTPLEQRMVHPGSGEIVGYHDAKRGLSVEGGGFVLLQSEELNSVVPPDSREIEVLQFHSPERLRQEWYERPYYLGPDGDPGEYFALARALDAEKRQGLARWVMRKKEYFGALRAEGAYLTLVTLHYAEEVVAASELPAVPKLALNPKELKMAEQLVAMFEDRFDPSQYRDEYRDRVLAFVESKAKGKPVLLRKFKPRKTEQSLLSALSESVKRARERKVA